MKWVGGKGEAPLARQYIHVFVWTVYTRNSACVVALSWGARVIWAPLNFSYIYILVYWPFRWCLGLYTIVFSACVDATWYLNSVGHFGAWFICLEWFRMLVVVGGGAYIAHKKKKSIIIFPGALDSCPKHDTLHSLCSLNASPLVAEKKNKIKIK